MPSPDQIKAAIGETEDKYFGDYEFSKDQHEAVEVLVIVAQAYLHALEQERANA